MTIWLWLCRDSKMKIVVSKCLSSVNRTQAKVVKHRIIWNIPSSDQRLEQRSLIIIEANILIGKMDIKRIGSVMETVEQRYWWQGPTTMTINTSSRSSRTSGNPAKVPISTIMHLCRMKIRSSRTFSEMGLASKISLRIPSLSTRIKIWAKNLDKRVLWMTCKRMAKMMKWICSLRTAQERVNSTQMSKICRLKLKNSRWRGRMNSMKKSVSKKGSQKWWSNRTMNKLINRVVARTDWMSDTLS